jgi:hypothetical protein
MAPLLLAIALSSTPALDDLARAAVEAAFSMPGGHAEMLAVEGAPARCTATSAEVTQRIAASGRFPLRLRGRDATGQACDGWAWARVRVSGPALVTTRAVADGEKLAGAIETVRREIASSRPWLTELPDGARAARALPPGTPLDPALIRIGPAPGEAVTVSLQLGALRVDELARAASCRAGRACAVLPSGRRVEGFWHDGRIVMDPP